MGRLLLLLLGCTGAAPGTPPSQDAADSDVSAPTATTSSPTETSVTTSPTTLLTQRRRVDLDVDKTAEIEEIDLKATLLSARDALVRRDDGRRGQRVTGRLHLGMSDQDLDVDFVSARAFEAFGYTMAVFGSSGWLDLSVFPPGTTVTPWIARPRSSPGIPRSSRHAVVKGALLREGREKPGGGTGGCRGESARQTRPWRRSRRRPRPRSAAGRTQLTPSPSTPQQSSSLHPPPRHP